MGVGPIWGWGGRGGEVRIPDQCEDQTTESAESARGALSPAERENPQGDSKWNNRPHHAHCGLGGSLFRHHIQAVSFDGNVPGETSWQIYNDQKNLKKGWSDLLSFADNSNWQILCKVRQTGGDRDCCLFKCSCDWGELKGTSMKTNGCM